MKQNRYRFKPAVIPKVSLRKAAVVLSVASLFSAVLIVLFQTGPKQEAVAGSGTATISAGSFIINMGVTPQTVANGLKSYGMIYDLMMNYNVPVIWSINPSKAKDGNDFIYGSVGYKGGPFIISAPYISAAVASRITYWQGQGVQGIYTTSEVAIPVYDTVTTFPPLIIDNLSSNQGIIMTYFSNASIPPTAYSIGQPASLTSCHDMWVNPHGDPTWATHSYLYNFVTVQKSYIWMQCHAVSMMEGCFNPSLPGQQLNYLSSNGLKCWKSSGCGPLITETHAKPATTPFTHFNHSDPVMQFMGSMGGATTDGSEQWFQPVTAGTGWRTTTKRGVTTATGTSPKEGAVLVYGPAYGNTANGWVMYEGGHDLNSSGTIAEKVAAQRAFFNFCLLAGKAKTVSFTSFNIPTSFQGSQALPVSVNVTSGTPAYTYQWTSSIPGGYFGNANAASTFYMSPPVMTTTNGVLTCTVTDQCGRRNFVSVPIIINPSPLPVMLLYFKLEVNSKNEVILTWSTASEKNNDYFTVERSADNNGFKEIGRVKGSGTTSQTKVYTLVDKQPLIGTSFYRLKQTDINGSYEVFASIEVKISRNDQARLTVFPNPFLNAFTVSFEAEHAGIGIYQVQLLSQDGRLLKNQQTEAEEGTNNIIVENLNLPSGKYIVRVLGEEKPAGSAVVICKR